MEHVVDLMTTRYADFRPRMEAARTNAEAGDIFISAGPRFGRSELDDYVGLVDRQTGGASSSVWTDFDMRNYLQHFWHPGKPRGSACAQLDRLGGNGDGGKEVCEAEATLKLPGPCLTLNVGSNGDALFEQSVHGYNPACEIHIMDPTLDEKKRSRIPKFATFYDEWFSKGTGALDRYRGRRINLLKIDCEGCEFDALPAWLAQTCTEQILIEVHGVSPIDPPGMDAGGRLKRFHKLMSTLEGNYTVFASEVNGISPPFTNVEYGLRRRTPCKMPAVHAGNVGRNTGGDHELVEDASSAVPPETDGELVNPRVLRILPAPSCFNLGLGLMHQQNNLECGLRLAAALGRRFEVWPLHEGSHHTKCKSEHYTAWEDIVDLHSHKHALPPAQHGVYARSYWAPSKHQRAATLQPLAPDLFVKRMPFNATLAGIEALKREMTADVLELKLSEEEGTYCNHYMRCAMLSHEELPQVRLEPSKSVEAAAAEMATELSKDAGYYDAVHLRQGDKVQEPMPGIAVPYLTPRDFTHRLLAMLPPPTVKKARRGLFQGGEREPCAGHEGNPLPPPLYVATDELEMLRSPCVSACYTPSSWADFVPILRRFMPSPHALMNECTPYWILAVEQRVLEKARAVVLSDTSNIGRAVALRRAQMGLDSDVRWLMSLSVMRSPPKTTSVATLETAFLQPDSVAAELLTAANASSWIGRDGAVASARVTALVGRLRRAHDSSQTGLGHGDCPEQEDMGCCAV